MVTQFPPNSDQTGQTSSSQPIDREQVHQQIAALGYVQGDQVFLRAFFPSTDSRKNGDAGRKIEATNLDQVIEHATKFQAEGRGVYLVINGGGHTDKEVVETRAIFYEHDDLEKSAQIDLWKSLGLPEPSLQIDTGGKSIHSYWIFEKRIEPELWRKLQTDLLEFANADRSLKNPSRVMRLAGAWHSSGSQSRIINNSNERYTYAELRSIIPTPQKIEATLSQSKSEREKHTFSNASKPERYEDVRVPVPMSAPLLCALGKASKKLLQGVSSSRNNSMAALARDVIGVQAEFARLGQATSDDAYSLFIDACRRCSSGDGWDEREWNSIWTKAIRSNPQASNSQASPESVENCIRGWYWREFGNKEHRGRSINLFETKTKLSMSEAAERAREILRSERDELTTNIKLEEVRQKAGMGDYAWEHKIIKPLKRDMDKERFKLELLSLLQMEDAVERCRQIALLAPKYSMGAGTIKEAMSVMQRQTQAPKVEVLTLENLFNAESEAMDWLVSGLLPVGETVLLYALPKVGKSKLAIDLAFCVATGESRFLGQETKQGKVLLITPDASPQSLKQELMKRGFRRQDTAHLHVIPRWSIDQMAVLEAELENFRPDLVVIDSLKKVTAGKEVSENSAEFADNIIALNDMLTRYRVAGILVHHANKGNDAIGVERARGSTAIVGACWGTWMLERIPKPDPNNAKRMIVDPKDPKRIFTATSRDAEGTTLNIEFNLDNNSWDFMGEVGLDEQEAGQQQTYQERILKVLRDNQRSLSGPEIMELLEIGKEQRGSIYTTLGRMENKRLINSRPAPGDKRYNLYSLWVPNQNSSNVTMPVNEKIALPPPPPSYTVSNVDYSSENHTQQEFENSQPNSQQIVNSPTDCDCVIMPESPTVYSVDRIVNTTSTQGGEGVVQSFEVDSVPLVHMPDEVLNKDELILLEMIQGAIASLELNVESARQTIGDILPTLTSECDSGRANRNKVWKVLTPIERAVFKILSEPIAPSKPQPEQLISTPLTSPEPAAEVMQSELALSEPQPEQLTSTPITSPELAAEIMQSEFPSLHVEPEQPTSAPHAPAEIQLLIAPTDVAKLRDIALIWWEEYYPEQMQSLVAQMYAWDAVGTRYDAATINAWLETEERLVRDRISKIMGMYG